jgi:hypothetical protein
MQVEVEEVDEIKHIENYVTYKINGELIINIDILVQKKEKKYIKNYDMKK